MSQPEMSSTSTTSFTERNFRFDENSIPLLCILLLLFILLIIILLGIYLIIKKILNKNQKQLVNVEETEQILSVKVESTHNNSAKLVHLKILLPNNSSTNRYLSLKNPNPLLSRNQSPGTLPNVYASETECRQHNYINNNKCPKNLLLPKNCNNV